MKNVRTVLNVVLGGLLAISLVAAVNAQPNSRETLEDAIKKHSDRLTPKLNDSLVFTADFKLSTSMPPKERFVAPLTRLDVRWVFRVPIFHERGYWDTGPYNGGRSAGFKNFQFFNAEATDGVAAFDWYLEKLIPLEKGNVEALKADFLACALVGFVLPDGKTAYVGPLHDLAKDISKVYTVQNDGKANPGYWRLVLIDDASCNLAHEHTLADKWFQSMHPTYRLKHKTRLNSEHGVFACPGPMRGDPTARFSYDIQSKWEGKYPTSLSVTLDLTPMKDHLYKVKTETTSLK